MLLQDHQKGQAESRQRERLHESYPGLTPLALLTEDMECADHDFCLLS